MVRKKRNSFLSKPLNKFEYFCYWFSRTGSTNNGTTAKTLSNSIVVLPLSDRNSFITILMFLFPRTDYGKWLIPKSLLFHLHFRLKKIIVSFSSFAVNEIDGMVYLTVAHSVLSLPICFRHMPQIFQAKSVFSLPLLNASRWFISHFQFNRNMDDGSIILFSIKLIF